MRGGARLPYLRWLQHCQRVGHSGKGLVGLLDIDGKIFNCVRGRGARLHKVKGGSGNRNQRERERERKRVCV